MESARIGHCFRTYFSPTNHRTLAKFIEKGEASAITSMKRMRNSSFTPYYVTDDEHPNGNQVLGGVDTGQEMAKQDRFDETPYK